MNCLLSGHDYAYDIQTITQIFFPNERFTRVGSADMPGLTAVSILAPSECRGAVYSDGRLVQMNVMPLPENPGGPDGLITHTPVADNVPGADDVPGTENVPGTDNVTSTENVPGTEDVTGTDNVPGADDVPGTDNVSGTDDVPGIDNVSGTDNVPGTGNMSSGCQEIRRRLMITLFLSLKSYTGQNPPWGALTGIRPSKMTRLLLEKGYSEESVINAMERNYLARRDKIALAVEVAKAEKEILGARPENAFCLYIGIPFCPSRCLYCSFASYPIGKDASLTDLYLDALEKELYAIKRMTWGSGVLVVYIGGGTPTALSEVQLDRLLRTVVQMYGGTKEFAVEAGRPDTLGVQKLRILKKFGVNRISINPQSLHDGTLIRIGRSHSAEDFSKSFALARAEGFNNINTDIILGLPGETPDSVKETMRKLLALKPENVTVHILTIKRASLLRETLEQYPLPNAGALEEMLDISRRMCLESGLRPYYMYRQKNMLGNFENVGYSLPGWQSLYNVHIMEETRSVWAAGAGAVTKLVFGDRIERVFNVKNLYDYIRRIDEMIGRKEDKYADSSASGH